MTNEGGRRVGGINKNRIYTHTGTRHSACDTLTVYRQEIRGVVSSLWLDRLESYVVCYQAVTEVPDRQKEKY